MSNRNVRKLCGGNTLPPPEDDDSESEFQPKFVQSAAESKYAGLEVSDNSDQSDQQQSDPNEEQGASGSFSHRHEDNEPSTSAGCSGQNKKKKRRTQKARKAKRMLQPHEHNSEMDEIDRLVLEVNSILGEPEPCASSEEGPSKIADFMMVQAKYLSAVNEYRRLFGRDEDERRYQPGHGAKVHRSIIVQYSEESYKPFRNGLSMSILQKQDHIIYFVYNHAEYYQKLQKMFLFVLHNRVGNMYLPLEVATKDLHIEYMLEVLDNYFRVEEYTAANELINIIVSFLQFCSHPSFDVTDPNVRLEYKYVENRVFHIAILKYMYMLTNKACHRTALELAKVMLRIDPSDPCGVMLIIDVLALRAREHAWLVEAFETWAVEKDANSLFNMQYSYPLCLYHLKKDSRELMKGAIMGYPTVVMKILEFCNQLTPRISEHPLFTTHGNKSTSSELQELIDYYAKLVYEKWREPEVLKWLLSVVNELLEDYDTEPIIQVRCMISSNERMNIYRGYPLQVIRHLAIVSPMWKLIIEEEPKRMIQGIAANPIPPVDSIDRYRYEETDRRIFRGNRSVWYNFFTSMNPNHRL